MEQVAKTGSKATEAPADVATSQQRAPAPELETKSTIQPIQAAGEDDEQGCLACLYACFFGIVQYVQNFIANLLGTEEAVEETPAEAGQIPLPANRYACMQPAIDELEALVRQAPVEFPFQRLLFVRITLAADPKNPIETFQLVPLNRSFPHQHANSVLGFVSSYVKDELTSLGVVLSEQDRIYMAFVAFREGKTPKTINYVVCEKEYCPASGANVPAKRTEVEQATQFFWVKFNHAFPAIFAKLKKIINPNQLFDQNGKLQSF